MVIDWSTVISNILMNLKTFVLKTNSIYLYLFIIVLRSDKFILVHASLDYDTKCTSPSNGMLSTHKLILIAGITDIQNVGHCDELTERNSLLQ